MVKKIDNKMYEEARQRADKLKAVYSARDTELEKYENAYLVKWDEQPDADGIKVTISPDARNVVLGAKRLMTATNPRFKIPDDRRDRIEKSDELELSAQRMWDISGKAARMPIHYGAVESSLLYSEVHIAISNTAALLERAKKGTGNAKRAEKISKQTPMLLECWNPRYGYPEFDIYGLCGYLRRAKVRAGELGARFGETGEAYLEGKDRNQEVELSIWYDTDNYVAWVETTCLIATVHDLPFIPVSVTVTDGSLLFDLPEDQRQPMLFGAIRSGFWERENLAQTVLYTNLFNIGINPTFIHNAPPSNPEKKFAWNSRDAGGVVDFEPGESIQAMSQKGIIDPSFQVAMEIAERKFSESTMYRQALGEPVKGSQGFSHLSLLTQSGRLPLVGTQTMTSLAIASAMDMAMEWYRTSSNDVDGYVKRKDIPEDLNYKVTLDVDLPQDKLQMANIASMLKREMLASSEWIQSGILQIEQPQRMMEDIMSEKGFEAMAAAYMQQKIAAYMQQLQQAQMQQMPANVGGMPGGMPGAGGMPGMPGEMPGQAGPAPVGAQGMPVPAGAEGQGFNPGMGGLPPAAAGMIPPGEGLPPEAMMGGMQ